MEIDLDSNPLFVLVDLAEEAVLVEGNADTLTAEQILDMAARLESGSAEAVRRLRAWAREAES